MILIRCNAGSQVGFGHLVRCRVLAKQLLALGHSCIMAGPVLSLKQPGDEKLFCQWIERPEWKNAQSEAQFHIELAEKNNIRHVVLDDYRSDYDHQLALRKAGLRCLQQYDASIAQKFAAQVVINCSPAEKRSQYEDVLYSSDIEMLHGPAYSILRPDFLKLPKISDNGNSRRILVTFGGGDDRGAMLTVLNALRDVLPDGYRLILVIGEHNPRHREISEWLAANPSQPVELFVNPENMPKIIANCEIAILGGGTTTFEVAYCGLPMILLPIAANQYKMADGWRDIGVALSLGPFQKLEKNALPQAVRKLAFDRQLYEKMAGAARQSVDGHGIDRIISHLLEGEA